MTMTRIKHGASLANIRPEMAIAHSVVVSVFHHFGYDAIITSGVDGEHSPKSNHRPWIALALDYRIRHVDDPLTLHDIIETVKNHLGPEFDVIEHETHIHVEFDPDYP